MKIFIYSTLIAVLTVACGCGENHPTQYGSEDKMVELNTNPPGCEVFVIPGTIWRDLGGESMLNDPARLKPYSKGFSPHTMMLTPHEQMLVAKYEHDGKVEYRSYTFTPGRESTPTVYFVK